MTTFDWCGGSNGEEKHGCVSVRGNAPVVINKFNGVRYCGIRHQLSFAELVRPESTSDGNYQCPEGFEPCNPSFQTQNSGADFIICRSKNQSSQSACPITSVAFQVPSSEFSDWEKRTDVAEISNASIYISR